MAWLQRLLLGAMTAAGISACLAAIRYLLPPLLYQRDFVQEYVFARAIWEHMSPYETVQALGALFLSRSDIPLFAHPTPHPPPVAFVALPFGLLPYEPAQIVWFLCEVLCLVMALRLLIRPFFPQLRGKRFALLCLLVLPLLHFWEELGLGQQVGLGHLSERLGQLLTDEHRLAAI
ncbi:MAG: DUF2029 domain-containing protein [Anaerolineae bacterium]|nr:DUF2029 domain-containing protein [Anaerolineae bacterium]